MQRSIMASERSIVERVVRKQRMATRMTKRPPTVVEL